MRVFCRICARMIYGTFDCSFSSKMPLKTLMCVSQSIDFFLTSTVLKTKYIMTDAAQP